MLYPKKVKHRKWFTMRQNLEKQEAHPDTRGTKLSFGSYGLKAMGYARVTSNQIEAARKVAMHNAGKTARSGSASFRIILSPEAGRSEDGKGKGDPQGFIAEVKPGRVVFEIDGVSAEVAHEAMRKAGTKLPVKTKVINRT